MSKNKEEAFETFDFDLPPIRGFPELRWAGKRPFTSTQYFPAQKKESYGDPTDGWWNRLYWGDNLQVMSHLLREFRGKVTLAYVDPPYDSKADYRQAITIRGKTASTDYTSFEETQYGDIWNNDSYNQYMLDRLTLMRELLSDDGSIYLHCDWHRSHHLRCILDEIFGPKRFQAEIIWQRTDPHNDAFSRYGRVHDTILWYSKGDKPKYNYKDVVAQLSSAAEKEYSLFRTEAGEIIDYYEGIDTPGRRFKLENATVKGNNLKRRFTWRGATPSGKRVWSFSSPEEMDQALDDGVLHLRDPSKGAARCLVKYLDENIGQVLQDIWQDAGRMKGGSDYPTRKPEQLLDRIIKASSDPGDIVIDCFMGSGTTQAAAMKLGRKFLGADINLGSIELTIKRINELRDEIANSDGDLFRSDAVTRYPGFEVYNVNNYEIFRNPVEAKELIKDAMELQPLASDSIFDGQRDQHLVKIMHVNRIATRQDLNEVINGLDFKAFERRAAEAPSKPVERIHLVCMGHEPDLGAELQKAAKPFDMEVMVTDLIRDKAHLHFKRASDARLKIEDDHLVITGFFPMNLLQKLSMEADAVEDWRRLVDSIKVDWNYDGAVLTPVILDAPEKDALVTGRYPIPDDAATIRVKITDLLSESWEGEISNG